MTFQNKYSQSERVFFLSSQFSKACWSWRQEFSKLSWVQHDPQVSNLEFSVGWSFNPIFPSRHSVFFWAPSCLERTDVRLSSQKAYMTCYICLKIGLSIVWLCLCLYLSDLRICMHVDFLKMLGQRITRASVGPQHREPVYWVQQQHGAVQTKVGFKHVFDSEGHIWLYDW